MTSSVYVALVSCVFALSAGIRVEGQQIEKGAKIRTDLPWTTPDDYLSWTPGFPGEGGVDPTTSESQPQHATTDDVTTNNGQVTMGGQTAETAPRHYLYDVSDGLFLYIFPVILVVGVAGNVMMLVIMQGKSQRGSSVAVFMSALACADTLVLLLDALNNWITMITHVDIVSLTATTCRVYHFLFSTVYTYSTWLVVMVAVERAIVVCYPLRAKAWCTVSKARQAVCVAPCLAAGVHAYNLWMWTLDSDSRCDVTIQYEAFARYVNPWLTAVVYSYLPLLVLVVSNAAILTGLARARASRKAMGVAGDESRSVTVPIVVISCVFVVLTVPLTLFYAVIFASGQFVEQTPGMALGRIVILILGLSNHAINFFLYVLTSRKFQVELKRIICMRGDEPAANTSQSAPENRGADVRVATESTSEGTCNI